jgi:sulfatase modifying factor 1
VQEMVEAIKASPIPSDIQPKLLSGISDYQADQPGDIRWRNVTIEENIDRRNYRTADNIDFIDGDVMSSIYYDQPDFEGNPMYDWGKTSLINDRSRVYKGASWADRIYWANPGTRRHLDERQSTATIGFRCAMTRVGSPMGMGDDKRRSKLKR